MLRVACHFDGHRASDHAQRPRGTLLDGTYWPLLDPIGPYWTPLAPSGSYLVLLDPLWVPIGPLIGPYWTLYCPR